METKTVLGALAVPSVAMFADYLYFRSDNKSRKELTAGNYFNMMPYVINKTPRIDLLFFEMVADGETEEKVKRAVAFVIKDGKIVQVLGVPGTIANITEDESLDDLITEIGGPLGAAFMGISDGGVYMHRVSPVTSAEILVDTELTDFWEVKNIFFVYLINLVSKLLDIKELVGLAKPATSETIKQAREWVNDSEDTAGIKAESLYLLEQIRDKEKLGE